MKKELVLKYVLYTVLLGVGVLFEQAPFKRQLLLLVIGLAFMMSQLIKDFKQKDKPLYAYLYLLDLGLIYGLDMLSKYAMNYFIQVMYLVLMSEIALLVRRKEWFFLCLATLFASAMKVGFLIQSGSTLFSYIQLGFFLVVALMLLFILQIFHRYRDEKEIKESLYKELLETHRQLKSSLERLQALSVVQERQRIARDLHDALGHDLTAIIYRLEVVQLMGSEANAERGAALRDIQEDSRSALRRVREVVETLREDKPHDSLESLNDLIKRFTAQTQIQVHLKTEGTMSNLPTLLEGTLFRIIQEGLTNVMRHANAHHVEIHLTLGESALEVFFRDDGSGDSAFQPGFGLKGMRERIEAIGGEVTFFVEHGFVIKASLPVGRGL